MTNRRILRLTGADTHDFLQGLVSNDVGKLSTGAVYAAMLTPQGKYLADFFLIPDGDDVLLDVAETLGDMLAQRLGMYKLRAAVTIEASGLHLHRGMDETPEDGFTDPRVPELGWRAYRAAAQTVDTVDWDALRVAHLVPETMVELTPDTFILEAGFERLNGVDFRKGCYVGQEVTARMKHKTELRKGLAQVDVGGEAPIGTELIANGKSAGRLFTQSGGKGIAYLRFDRATGPMTAESAQVTWAAPTKST
ncbi:folate-binding protein YgfZ [Sulfitobacter sp. M57]|uniref:CAF17-like 4Fe-4S cluster assembly/insertion protein YgfZ n=1 Tax=unclassified Sulfitobacter TaxID=196795 RepID=UPI0023E23307|nr:MULTISPECIES: folate-binding protein [unclassified Sulfitobacter]MDF3413046.1 folate-binding protein YgfZ [Sulfitobacter sp. KE5]MDF3421670.1 folate-binding protein YgfZ [Sulfitobacter sp. KE43]MDF3431595.1 folate-binding protein YgfZ [Sulfitobacter sp. KE42]MDF3457236.1 folate-binding protein YgfZ [Sulfitobacter sp. S74]MDF3461139.1 folate-binding protein YgfZ [Sulfitobacter sp. Ks18]